MITEEIHDKIMQEFRQSRENAALSRSLLRHKLENIRECYRKADQILADMQGIIDTLPTAYDFNSLMQNDR